MSFVVDTRAADDTVRRSPRALFPGASWWVGAIILTMPARDLTLGTLGRANLRIGDLVLALALIAWVLFRGGRLRIQRSGLDLAIFLFVAAHLVSVLWSGDVNYGWVRAIKLTRNAAMYALIVSYLRCGFKAGFRTIALCLVVTGVIQSAVFVQTVIQRGGLEAVQPLFEASSLLSNDPRLLVVKHDTSGGVFLKGAAVWLCLCIFFGVGVAPQMRTVFGVKGVRILVAFMTAVTVLTLNRSAWIGLAVGACVFVVTDRARRAVKRVFVAGVIVVLLAIAGLFGPLSNIITARLGVETTTTDPTMRLRFEFAEVAFRHFQDSPLQGAGVGGILYGDFGGIAVHNVYMQVLGELGLIGAALFVFILWKWGTYLLQVRRHSAAMGAEHGRIVAAAMLAAMAFFLTFFLVGHELEGGEPWLVLAVSSALHGCAIREMAARRASWRPDPAFSAGPSLSSV